MFDNASSNVRPFYIFCLIKRPRMSEKMAWINIIDYSLCLYSATICACIPWPTLMQKKDFPVINLLHITPVMS